MTPRKKAPKIGRPLEREGLRAERFSASLPRESLAYLKRCAKRDRIPFSTLLNQIILPWIERRKRKEKTSG